MKLSEALDTLVKRFGRDSRVYSVTFDDNGKWRIAVMSTDNGAFLERFYETETT